MKSTNDKYLANTEIGTPRSIPIMEGKRSPVELYESLYGTFPVVVPLKGSGGDRRYWRLAAADRPPVIGTHGSNLPENKSFIRLARVFRDLQISVPEILAADEDMGSYLQEDLGDVSLLDLLSTGQRIELSEKSLRQLVKMQVADERVWLPHVCSREFSKRVVMWDLNYFKYEFVKPCAIDFDEDSLEDDFERLGSDMSSYDSALWGFMYRDFQSRNIIIKEGKPFFIDFQGGRKGPGLYDAVSLLWQAKAGFTPQERKALLDVYADAYSRERGVGKDRILAKVGEMALLRTLQVLGAYGFRGLVEKRSHFIESIPGALRNLSELLGEGVLDSYPELRRVCRQLTESRYSKPQEWNGLTVKVFSFSYKRGYPEDLSGNGGGFMFDCRGMHNPGRYDRYKPLTGMDREVVEFLEERGEVQDFLSNAMRMVMPSVRRYLERGFSSLQIGFGCTGGRHRSVYCAEQLAARLAAAFPEARIELIHREQHLTRVFNQR